MATSTLRALILVALVVLGIVGITKLFPENVSLGITGQSPGSSSPSASPSASPSSSPSATPTRKAKVRGTVVRVLNGSGQTGLAGEVSTTLKNAHFTVKDPANAPHRNRTVIYYRADSQPEALLVQRKYFPDAVVKPAPASVPADVQVEIILGTDFIAASSSP